MNENSIHPLTEERVAELWDTHAADTVPWDDWYGGSRRALTSMLRAAFDAGQKYQDDLEDDTIRNIMKDVHHLRVERDTADNVVADLTAKVARVEALADRLDNEAAYEASRGDTWDATCIRAEARRIRKALNGENA
mgnify:CR=1 FL=1